MLTPSVTGVHTPVGVSASFAIRAARDVKQGGLEASLLLNVPTSLGSDFRHRARHDVTRTELGSIRVTVGSALFTRRGLSPSRSVGAHGAPQDR